MDLSCPSNVRNKFIRKIRFWAFLRFGSPLLILRKNEGIIILPCSAIKQARSRGNFDANYTPLSTIKPQLILLSRHFNKHTSSAHLITPEVSNTFKIQLR